MLLNHHLIRLKKILPFVILLLAFFLQMQYLAELRDIFSNGFAQPFCGIDAIAYDQRASGMLDGSVPGERPFYFIPLYPSLLAMLKTSLGNSILLPIFMQALLQILGIAALYSLGRMIFSPLVGILAALGMATYNYYIFYLPCFDQSLLTTPFFTLTLYFVIKHYHSQKPNWLVAAGVTLALTILSRPTVLLVLPIIIGWLYFTRPITNRHQLILGFIDISPRALRVLGRDIVFLTLPFIILVAPITWHNYQATGRFILVSDNFDVNLFTGNNPDASGLDTLAHAQGQPAELRFREAMERQKSGETTLTAEAVEYIVNQPGDWLALTATKTWLWFGEVDERLVTPVFPLTIENSKILSSLPLDWQALAIAALLGLLLVRGRSRSQTMFLWLVYGVFSLVTILFFIQLRFRLPFLPFVLLLAASLMASARQWHHTKSWRFWLTLTILLILFPLVPSLWIFVLFFAGFGLFPDKSIWSTKKTRAILILLSISVYLLLVGLWVKTEARASDASQTIDHYLGPPLVGNGILGQTFAMNCNNLNQIEVTLGIFNHQHDQPVTFNLATDSSGRQIIYSETFDGSSVTDHQKKIFSFEPVPDSAGRTFLFFLSSPTSTPENAITARGYSDTPVDHYPAGQALAGDLNGLQKIDADFAFTASCQTSWAERLRMAKEFR